jgi:hypothetical protein
VKQTVVSQEFQEKVAEEFYRRVEAARKRPRGERDALEQSVREKEARVQKITEGFARVGFSEALAAQLRQEEGRLRELRSRLAALEPEPEKGAQGPRPGGRRAAGPPYRGVRAEGARARQGGLGGGRHAHRPEAGERGRNPALRRRGLHKHRPGHP